MKRFAEIIALLGLTTYLGNLINIGMTHAVAWTRMDITAFMTGFGEAFLLLLPTLFITLLPGFIALIIILVKKHGSAAARKHWRMALYATLVSLTISMTFHLPTNFGFMELSYSVEEAASRLQWWIILHWVRIALALVGAVYAVLGFQKTMHATA